MKLILFIIIFAKNLRLHGIGQRNICFFVKHYFTVNISDRFTLNFVSQNIPRKAWSPRYYFVRIHDILVCKVLHIEVRGKSLTQCSALKHVVHICQRLSSCSRQPHTIATVLRYCTVLCATPVYRLQSVEMLTRSVAEEISGTNCTEVGQLLNYLPSHTHTLQLLVMHLQYTFKSSLTNISPDGTG